jgi:hypothetical protein
MAIASIPIREIPDHTQPTAFWHVIKTLFSVDYRALASVRICVGLTLLGLQMCDAYGSLCWTSPYMLSGEIWFQFLLMLFAAVFAFSLAIGYRTTLATVVSLFMFTSILGRHPFLQQGGDVLLRCLLCWSVFLPMGAVWSFDSRCVLIQLAIVYVVTAMLKYDPVWRTTYDATYYALSLHHFTTPLGYVILGYPTLLRFGTASTLWLEYVGPILLFIPIAAVNRLFRIIVPILFIGFHLSTGIFMELGFFPMICLSFWLIVFPKPFWDLAERIVHAIVTRLQRPSTREGIPSFSPSSDVIWQPFRNVDWIVLLLGFYMLLINFARLYQPPYAEVVRGPLGLMGKIVGLDQHWNMFSPGVWDHGSWLQIRGKTAEGTLVNLWRPDQPLGTARPELISAMYPTVFHRRHFQAMYESQEYAIHQGTTRFLMNQWNRSHPKDLEVVSADVYLMMERTPEPGKAYDHEVTDRLIYSSMPK